LHTRKVNLKLFTMLERMIASHLASDLVVQPTSSFIATQTQCYRLYLAEIAQSKIDKTDSIKPPF
jgi:hypothetical protein